MPKAFRITAPSLTDDERAQSVKPGGLSGQIVDTTPLLGPLTRERKFKAPASLHGINMLPTLYGDTVDPAVKEERRQKNRQARKSRRANRSKG